MTDIMLLFKNRFSKLQIFIYKTCIQHCPIIAQHIRIAAAVHNREQNIFYIGF